MPKIERSVDYTFEAYSGLEDGEVQNKTSEKMSDFSLQNSELTAEDCSDIDSASELLSLYTRFQQVFVQHSWE